MIPDMTAGMQAGSKAVFTFHLQALVAQIAHAGIRILADEDAGADITTGILFKMAADGQRAHIDIIAGQ